MADYKGIGFDATNATNRTGTSSDTVQFTPQVDALNGAAVTGNLSVSADCSIAGDLDVQGDIISRGAVNLVVEDDFIDLNFGNTTTTSQSGGLTISMNRTTGFTASTVTTFVAGIASTSNPTFTNTDATGSSLLAAADIVMITGATQQGNNGLYQVSAVNQASFPQIVTIKGIGTSAVDGSLPFCQNQFEAETGATASAMKIDLAVWAVADGTNNFLDDGGSNYAKGTFLTAYATAAVLSDFDGNGDYTVATSTLQSAYNGGATIVTASSTDIAYTLTSGDFTAAGAGGVLLTPTSASSFTSGGALTLTGGGASTWSTGAGALTLTSAAAATWSTGAGLLTVDGAGGISLAGNSSEIDITTTGAVDINGAGITIDGTGTSNLTTTAAALTVSTVTSGTLSVTSAGTLAVDGVAVNIDSSGAMDITAADGQTLSVNHGGGSALAFNATGQIDMTGESASAINIGTTAAALSLSTTTSGELDITSAGLIDMNAGANLDVDVTGTVDILASSTFSVDGTGASNVTATSGDLTLSTATSGNVDITAADDVNIAAAGSDVGINSATLTVDTTAGISLDAGAASNLTTSAGALTLDGAAGVSIAGNAAEVDVTTSGALDLNSGAGSWDASTLSIDSTDTTNLTMAANVASVKTMTINASNANGGGSATISMSAPEINISAGLKGTFSGFEGISNAAFSKGDLLYMLATTGKVDKSDADAILTSRILGVAGTAASAADEAIPVINYGVVTIVADAGVAASKMGQPCYVSLTAGLVTMTPPNADGDVVYQVGIVILADGGTGIDVLLQPQFILENA